MRSIWIGVALLGVFGAVAIGGARSTHTASRKTDNFEIRYRPGSRAGASSQRVAALAERELARIAGQLDVKPAGGYELFLYDDVPELHAITANTSSGGFSAGKESHLPHDNDQTRYHEMVHLVAAELPKTGDEERSLFYAEGLANALLEYVHGVHVHAVAAYYKSERRLPPLTQMLGDDFYAWLRKHPGFNGYDVAGSFLRHLIDTYGIEKVKPYYTGTPAKKAFGVSPKQLETSWHVLLDAYELTPEVRTLLARGDAGRKGDEPRFDVYAVDPDLRLPKDLLGKPKDWKSLLDAKLVPLDGALFERGESGLLGHGGDGSRGWRICELGSAKYGDCAVRLKAEVVGFTGGVRVQLGQGAQAMLVNGTFVYRDAKPMGSSHTETIGGRQHIDLLVVRRAGKLAIWVDGFRIVEAAVDTAKAPVGVGVIQGKVRFTDIRVRTKL